MSGHQEDRRPPIQLIVFGGGGTLGESIIASATCNGWLVAAPAHAEVDVTDAEQTFAFVAAHPAASSIVNCAGLTDPERCHRHPRECLDVNCVGALNVARAASALDRHLVHVSTDAVFSGTARSAPYLESDVPGCPASVYGVAKLAAEHVLATAGPAYLVVRLGWLLGRAPERDPKFVGRILLAAGTGQHIRAVTDKVGTVTYAPHAADAILRFCAARMTGLRHLACADVVTRFELARRALALWFPGASLEPADSSEFPSDVARSDFSALHTTFDDARLPPLDDALREHFAAHRTC